MSITIGDRIKNFKFRTERFIVATDDNVQHSFFSSDLTRNDIEQFIPLNVLGKQISHETHYTKDGLGVIQFNYETR